MKRCVCLILSIIYVIWGLFVYAENEAEQKYILPVTDAILLDDCVDFSIALNHSENLYVDVTVEENRYAFDDYTMFMRSTPDAQWVEYEIPQYQYMIFHTYFRQNEEISHFLFSWSSDGEKWYETKPEIDIGNVENWRWIPVIYQLKNIDKSAKYIRITYGNIDGTVWSPSIAGVYTKYYSNNQQGFIDCEDTPYQNDATFLKNLGLISGYNEYEFKPENDITRAEFAKLIANAINVSGGNSRIFYDVKSDHWAASCLSALYGLGIISGDENGYFQPELSITCQEAVKMAVSALGYSVTAENKGGYPNGYMLIANQLGILDNINVLGDCTINRGTSAIMLSNMLSSKINRQVIYGDKSIYDSDEITALNYYHNIWEIKGQVTNIGAKSIGSTEILKENQIIVGEKLYYVKEGFSDDLLGVEVSAYVKRFNDSRDDEIIYAMPLSGTKLVEVEPPEYLGIDNGKICIFKDNVEKKYGFTNNTRVVYNGRYHTRMGINDNLSLSCGYMRLIINPDDSNVDVIIVEEFTTTQATADFKLKDVYDGNYDLNDVQEINLNLYGESVKYTPDVLVREKDIINVAMSYDGVVAKIFVLNNNKTGILELVNSENGYAKIAGEKYIIANNLDVNDINNLLGKDVICYSDVNKAICIIEENSSMSGYGYLLAATIKYGLSQDAILRVVMQDGTVREFTTNSKSKLNGEKVNGKNFAALSPQLIRYSVRDDGIVARLETAIENNQVGAEEFSKNYQSNSSKYYGDKLKVFSSVYQIAGGTKIFWIPENTEDIDEYKVSSGEELINDKSYSVSIYDVDGNYNCGAIVIDVANSENRTLEYSDPVAIIEEVRNIFDKDGNLCLDILVKKDGQDTHIYFDTDGGEDVTGNWIPDYVSRQTANGNNPFSKGEVLQYYMDSKSHVKFFKMLMTKDAISNNLSFEKNFGEYGALSQDRYFSELYTILGKVKNKTKGKIIASVDGGYLRTLPITDAKIYIISKNGRLLEGDVTDISNGDRIFARMNYTVVKEIIVLEN